MVAGYCIYTAVEEEEEEEEREPTTLASSSAVRRWVPFHLYDPLVSVHRFSFSDKDYEMLVRIE